jgi:hypothetical protein
MRADTVALIRKLVSGGQTGVDRAALDFAIENDIPYGGWVPKGGRAEDMAKPPGLVAVYSLLREHSSRDWAPRTKANIVNSNATLVIYDGHHPKGPGTKLTINLANSLNKPLLILNIRSEAVVNVAQMEVFLTQFDTDIALNVAGSRESSIPGTYSAAKRVLATFDGLFVL